mgnify:CR=1 FL=1
MDHWDPPTGTGRGCKACNEETGEKPMTPSELQRVQALLADIERAASQLKDELVNVRARERGTPSEQS